MLIPCPECRNNVSDKAQFCPQCGYPINTPPKASKRDYSRPKRFRRLPNGFGSIRRLSGNRRNPYAAYPPVTEWTATAPVTPKAIGYFPTYNDAYQALSEYNKNPYDLDNVDVTFANVFKGYVDFKTGQVTKSTISGYHAAFKYFATLHDVPMRKLRAQDMQSIVDTIPFKRSSTERCKNLLTGMFKYAIQNGIVTTNYASAVVIKKPDDTERGVPFTIGELKRLWSLRDDTDIQVLLILIYTGMRIGELQGYENKGNYLIGGSKTTAGRDRIIPIIEEMRQIIDRFDNKSFNKHTFANYNHLPRALSLAGCEVAASGEKHTSHDCRHTFSWLADRAGMDSLAKHLIMGHSLGSDVEVNTYGHRTTEELITEMNRIHVEK